MRRLYGRLARIAALRRRSPAESGQRGALARAGRRRCPPGAGPLRAGLARGRSFAVEGRDPLRPAATGHHGPPIHACRGLQAVSSAQGFAARAPRLGRDRHVALASATGRTAGEPEHDLLFLANLHARKGTTGAVGRVRAAGAHRAGCAPARGGRRSAARRGGAAGRVGPGARWSQAPRRRCAQRGALADVEERRLLPALAGRAVRDVGPRGHGLRQARGGNRCRRPGVPAERARGPEGSSWRSRARWRALWPG